MLEAAKLTRDKQNDTKVTSRTAKYVEENTGESSSQNPTLGKRRGRSLGEEGARDGCKKRKRRRRNLGTEKGGEEADTAIALPRTSLTDEAEQCYNPLEYAPHRVRQKPHPTCVDHVLKRPGGQNKP